MNSVNGTVSFMIMKLYLTISIYLKGRIFQGNLVFLMKFDYGIEYL